MIVFTTPCWLLANCNYIFNEIHRKNDKYFNGLLFLCVENTMVLFGVACDKRINIKFVD